MLLRAPLTPKRHSPSKFGSKVSVKAAPIKGLAQMRNKVSNDHAMKKRPRPMHNIDTVRAGVVVNDASLMEDVFDAIGAEVGPWLRVKNNYRSAFNAKESYGYRALLGNLTHSSGMTCGEIFGGDNNAAWLALKATLDSTSDRSRVGFALDALVDEDKGCRDVECKIAAEVQIIYKPYLTEGRVKSHLYYKIVRCKAGRQRAAHPRRRQPVRPWPGVRGRRGRLPQDRADRAVGGEVGWRR